MLSYTQREREKCIGRMNEAQQMKEMLNKEKERWAKGVELQ